jgi:hypothetical protein
MRITARAEVRKEIFDTHKDVLKHELMVNVSKELMKHNVFIEPPMSERNNTVSMEMHFFALSYDDVSRLKELANKYPEIKGIVSNIVVKP